MKSSLSILFCVVVGARALDVTQTASTIRSNLRALQGTCSSGFDCSGDNIVCRKGTSEATTSQCLLPASQGEYCENSDHCVAPYRCYAEECSASAAVGGPCQYSMFGDDRQCRSGYCDSDSVCKAFKSVGEACDNKIECDNTKNTCNTAVVGGENVCVAWKKNGDSCSSDSECGGPDPPNSLAYCTDGTCSDLGSDIATGLGILLAIYIIVPLIALCCLIACIYALCCKKNTVVVVQNQ